MKGTAPRVLGVQWCLAALALLGAACVTSTPPPQVPSAPPQLLSETELRRLLAAAVLPSILMEDLYAELSETGRRVLVGQGREWAGLNPEPTLPGVAIYVVDVPKLMADARTCGGDSSAAREREACRKAEAVTNNCAVVGADTVACDLRFLWQLRRAAVVLTLSHIKNPETGKYYFNRVEVRNKFLAGEGLDPSTEQALENLRALNRFLGLDLVKPHVEDFQRIQSGFVRFILAHELGHIIKRHAVGAGFVPCAEGKVQALHGSYRRACDVGGRMENEADEFAMSVLAEGIVPDRFTPERAIPELFIEQHEGRVFRAMAMSGLDPTKDSLASLPPEVDKRFVETLFRLTVTETHPSHLRRYVRLMRLLQERKVPLTVSLQMIELAEQFSVKVQEWCSAP